MSVGVRVCMFAWGAKWVLFMHDQGVKRVYWFARTPSIYIQ